jgi:glycerol kinase
MSHLNESAFDESPRSTPASSRRPSMAMPRPMYAGSGGSGGLSRRSSYASGPRPITKHEYSGPPTPSLLSRAGSPTQPLANEKVASRKSSFASDAGLPHPVLGKLGGLGGFSAIDSTKELRKGEFIASLDCGTT